MSNAQVAHILDTVLATWTADRYTTGFFARDTGGYPCVYDHPSAQRWCVQGILNYALRSASLDEYDAVWDYIEQSKNALFGDDIALPDVNDQHGYHAARAVLAHARARLGTGGAHCLETPPSCAGCPWIYPWGGIAH